MKTKTTFSAGRNMAMKAPPHLYHATIQFYRDVFVFVRNNLWVDCIPGLSQRRCGGKWSPTT
jgi:hypothetical protein